VLLGPDSGREGLAGLAGWLMLTQPELERSFAGEQLSGPCSPWCNPAGWVASPVIRKNPREHSVVN
jgi:hypothetical protein